MTTCSATINFERPNRSEKRRGFQPPWYTVFIYHCVCGAPPRYLRANSFRGRQPVPNVGAMVCGHPIAESEAK